MRSQGCQRRASVSFISRLGPTRGRHADRPPPAILLDRPVASTSYALTSSQVLVAALDHLRPCQQPIGRAAPDREHQPRSGGVST